MRIFLFFIVGSLLGLSVFQGKIVIDKQNELKEIKNLANKKEESLKEFKESKNLNSYLKKVNDREPEVSFYKKNGQCFQVSKHDRPFNLGRFKVTTKINCSL